MKCIRISLIAQSFKQCICFGLCASFYSSSSRFDALIYDHLTGSPPPNHRPTPCATAANAPSIATKPISGSAARPPPARPSPELQNDVLQHDVHAYSFVRSPITMQPASQSVVQRRSSDHMRGWLVAFSVLVVYENRFTMHVSSDWLHLRWNVE